MVTEPNRGGGADPLIGQELGSYRIVSVIGAGGMGAVYRAQHQLIEREAAIKVLLPEMSRNGDVVRRFLAEARATARLQHPGIVQILDCGVHQGQAFIAMELLRGQSLRARLAAAGGAITDVDEVRDLFAQIAAAVAAAHAQQIVHRDLKPDNVFLVSAEGGGRPVAKVLDFGVAKLRGENKPAGLESTRTGELVGTPLYMSPEQARGDSTLDARSDIYSFGCMLFEALAGRPPFRAEFAAELLVAHISETAPPLGEKVAGVPRRLAELVARCLEKDPAQRPQQMSEIADLLASLQVEGRTEPKPSTTTVPRRGADRRSRLSGRQWGWVITPALAGAGVIALFLAGRTPKPASPPVSTVVAPAPAPAPPIPAAPAFIAVQVNGAPAGTRVTVDGQEQPFPLRLPRAERTRALVFAAPGYEDQTVPVDTASDQVIDLAMKPVPPPARVPEKRPSRVRAGKPPPSAQGGRAGSFQGFDDI